MIAILCHPCLYQQKVCKVICRIKPNLVGTFFIMDNKSEMKMGIIPHKKFWYNDFFQLFFFFPFKWNSTNIFGRNFIFSYNVNNRDSYKILRKLTWNGHCNSKYKHIFFVLSKVFDIMARIQPDFTYMFLTTNIRVQLKMGLFCCDRDFSAIFFYLF